MIKLGADCEFFLQDSDRRITSAIGKIGGNKMFPLWVAEGNLQEDNILAEMAIHPASTKSQWLHSLINLKRKLQHHVKPHNYTLSSHPYAILPTSSLESFGENAMKFGCSPDINAYTRLCNPAPRDEIGLRTASGHVHFSYKNPTFHTTANIIQILDYLLGSWSVFTDSKDNKRRELYGRAGSFREKSYGGEYRVLSNFWVFSTKHMSYVWDMVRLAIVRREALIEVLPTICSTNDVQDIINTYDKAGARQLHAQVSEAIR